VRELGAEAVLIGRPLHLSGYAGAQAGYVERLGEHLRRVLDIPIVYWDERLSTVSAERELRDMGYAASQRAAMRDAVAAAIILQSYLDAQRRQDRDTPSVLTG
jgi:putative Holliday junction resolvase